MDLKQFSVAYKKRSSFLARLQRACQNLLQTHSLAHDVRQYLNSRVPDLNLQEKFLFGFFPPDDQIELLFPDVSLEELLHYQIIYPHYVQNDNTRILTYKSYFHTHNLVWPYMDLYGNIVSFLGRTCITEEERKRLGIDKYMYTKGFAKSLQVFGLYQAKKAILEKGYAIVVEGQLDCISCHFYGIENVVGLGGVTLGKYQKHLIRRFTDKFYLCLDGDMEGQKSMQNIIKRDEGIEFKTLTLPSGYKDIDLYLKNTGNVQVLNW